MAGQKNAFQVQICIANSPISGEGMSFKSSLDGIFPSVNLWLPVDQLPRPGKAEEESHALHVGDMEVKFLRENVE